MPPKETSNRILPTKSPKQTQAARNYLIQRDGMNCHWCKKTMDLSAPLNTGNFPTIEHILPKAKGGTDDERNLALACRTCNGGRRDTFPFDKEFLRKQIQGSTKRALDELKGKALTPEVAGSFVNYLTGILWHNIEPILESREKEIKCLEELLMEDV